MYSTGAEELAQREVFEGELMDGETIQWVGQPDPSVIFSKGDIFLIPFSIIWCGFSLLFEVTFLMLVLKGGDAPWPLACSDYRLWQ